MIPEKINPKTYGWNWGRFTGSAVGLNLNHRDLQVLDHVLTLVARPRVAVQAGGNLGIFPKRLAQVCEAVYTFEPDAACFASLSANAPESNILRFQAALGYERRLVGTSGVRRAGRSTTWHEGLTHVVEGAGVIPTLRIDDLQLPVCDLIYLDIEGSEPEALRGAEATLARCRPVLAVEIHEFHVPFNGVPTEALRAQIRGYGYRPAGVFLADEVFIAEAA
jgi:FkbM family methyltransferase